MTSERRVFLRVEADLDVICSRIDASGEREPAMTGRTIDVSAGGIRLAAGLDLQIGERVWLEVRFREPHFLIFAESEVVRVDGNGAAGIRFDELETYTQQRVVRWVYAQDRRLFDRRSQTRLPVRLRALVRRIDSHGHPVEEFAAPTLDVSLDGVRIGTDRVLAVGTRVELEIAFPDEQPPFVQPAGVAWAGRGGDRLSYGLAFTDISPGQQRHLIERSLAAEKQIDP